MQDIRGESGVTMQVNDQSASMQRGVGWVLVSFLTTCWVFCHPSKAIADVVPAAPASDLRSVVLTGKIVTMNAARDVWPEGAVWVHNGVIVAAAPDLMALEAAIAGTPQVQALQAAPVVNVRGVIYPG
ncbi:MAG: hypothetical protein ACKO15_00565, partial [Burkholderiales bacterium]